jgi:uncharacterized repeat protein (TIGR03837 family)
MKRSLQWDIFCKVIDNFGDIGICWRLAADLASRGEQVRLWVDDASALAWMAPAGCEGVQVLAWNQSLAAADLGALATAPADVMIEAFGCEIAPEFVAECARNVRAGALKPVWINLEYLTAEPYAERNHGLPSPVPYGPAAGWSKLFFYPGFTPRTGGLLREPGLGERQSGFLRDAWLASKGIRPQGQLLVSMFCYEPHGLGELLCRLAENGIDGRPVQLLVTAGRAGRAVKQAIAGIANSVRSTPPSSNNTSQKGLQSNIYRHGLLSISYLPLLTQIDFDRLLWSCDLNFVRGEDSVIRAVWAGQPFVWQIYPQDDGAHRVKLDAFLDMLEAPASLRAFHQHWNAGPAMKDIPPADISKAELQAWSLLAQAARARQMAQDDLTTRLRELVGKSR